MKTCRLLLVAIICAVVPATAWSQAQTSLSSLRVRYNTRKATVQPAGALKVEIDAIDRELAEVSRLGRTGDMRRTILEPPPIVAYSLLEEVCASR